MPQNDLRELRQLLGQVVQRLGRTSRELEERLEIGHGNLGKLLNGTIELRVRHLLAFAELLRVPVTELLAAGCPGSAAAATQHLTDWLPQVQGDGGGAAAAQARMPVTLAELTELLRREIGSELAKRGLEAPPARPGGGPEAAK
jgi:transcriptional regulator with XRE-family HTH domain